MLSAPLHSRPQGSVPGPYGLNSRTPPPSSVPQAAPGSFVGRSNEEAACRSRDLAEAVVVHGAAQALLVLHVGAHAQAASCGAPMFRCRPRQAASPSSMSSSASRKPEGLLEDGPRR